MKLTNLRKGDGQSPSHGQVRLPGVIDSFKIDIVFSSIVVLSSCFLFSLGTIVSLSTSFAQEAPPPTPAPAPASKAEGGGGDPKKKYYSGIFYGTVVMLDRKRKFVFVRPSEKTFPRRVFYIDKSTKVREKGRAKSLAKLRRKMAVKIAYLKHENTYLADEITIYEPDGRFSDVEAVFDSDLSEVFKP